MGLLHFALEHVPLNLLQQEIVCRHIALGRLGHYSGLAGFKNSNHAYGTDDYSKGQKPKSGVAEINNVGR
jgi:hypothetical protein